MRKHFSQMQPAELEEITKFIRSMQVRRECDHAEVRKAQKNVTPKELELVLKYGTPVEIHNEAGEARVLIRLTCGRPKVHICAVLGLQSATLVTVWKNAGSDNHATLDWSLYNWKIDTRTILAKVA